MHKPGRSDVGVDDDGCGTEYGPSLLTADLSAGTYYVTIEGYSWWEPCVEYVLVVSRQGGWPTAAVANASVYGSGSTGASGISNPLVIVLLPMGMIVFLRRLHRRK